MSIARYCGSDVKLGGNPGMRAELKKNNSTHKDSALSKITIFKFFFSSFFD
jgi:hypothetical protein